MVILTQQENPCIVTISYNNVALPYFTFGYFQGRPEILKFLKIGDGYVIAAK